MQPITTTVFAPTRPNGVTRHLRRIADHMAERRRRRQTYALLANLEDRILDDIGISRAEVEAGLRRGFL
ncbi:DUF1127 domain-containing protein [Zavarzinia compransoris]|uniref:DUF1127 domain-containing protein n=1 Tax=Zavarzinia marina TaxID=2911065 RepID=UPI001F2F257A|nr:DUF1127 domain-containing protein [Zavarzinia marina]MCF4164863.1 DUF1127 domain-containing protein [Zavarzinia marina]